MHQYEWHVTLDQEDHPDKPCEDPGCTNAAAGRIAVKLWPPQGDDSAEEHFFCGAHAAAADKLKAKLEIDSMTLND